MTDRDPYTGNGHGRPPRRGRLDPETRTILVGAAKVFLWFSVAAFLVILVINVALGG